MPRLCEVLAQECGEIEGSPEFEVFPHLLADAAFVDGRPVLQLGVDGAEFLLYVGQRPEQQIRVACCSNRPGEIPGLGLQLVAAIAQFGRGRLRPLGLGAADQLFENELLNLRMEKIALESTEQVLLDVLHPLSHSIVAGAALVMLRASIPRDPSPPEPADYHQIRAAVPALQHPAQQMRALYPPPVG